MFKDTGDAHNAWLNLGDTRKLVLFNPLMERSQHDKANPGLFELRLLRQPEFLGTAVKVFLNIELLPIQTAILQELWVRPFPMFLASRGFGKSFLLSVLAMLRCLLVPQSKVVVVGAAFRQSKILFEYMHTIWRNAPILRSVCDNNSGPKKETDCYTMHINDSVAMCVPLGDGTKIRGLRANVIISDEFAAIPPDIYETVVSGFAAVSSNPVGNVKEAARRKKLHKLGLWTADQEHKYNARGGNKAIISGTAYYEFNHFCKYWDRYHRIIESRGNKRLLEEIFQEDLPSNFSWTDYSIIRIPYELIPEGFMDDRVISRAKATVHSTIYDMEYGCCFAADSDGFYKRSLIEKCVGTDSNPVMLPSGPVWFDARLSGDPNKSYVIGVDPASERDNFSIVVLELWPKHVRIVYTWSTNRREFNQRVKAGDTEDKDFYGFCARKIRDLMRLFPCRRIAMDCQGGGIAVAEALHDPKRLASDEQLIWPIIDKNKKADTDREPGLHILELVQFAKYEWVRDANHGMRKDFEDRVLLFPRFDTVSLALAAGMDKFENKSPLRFDTLEDCLLEIEALKDELSTIIITLTGTGVNNRERWDTPEIKTASGKKGRMRKDRYSALLMANMAARQMYRHKTIITFEPVGGTASDLANKSSNDKMYTAGPEWFLKGANQSIYYGLSR